MAVFYLVSDAAETRFTDVPYLFQPSAMTYAAPVDNAMNETSQLQVVVLGGSGI